MTEQEYNEIEAEVKNSTLPLPTQEKVIDACRKQVAEKLKHEVCPKCGTNNDMIIKHLGNPQAHKVVYCWNCGCSIDWSEEE